MSSIATTLLRISARLFVNNPWPFCANLTSYNLYSCWARNCPLRKHGRAVPKWFFVSFAKFWPLCQVVCRYWWWCWKSHCVAFSEALDEAHSRAGRWTPQTVSVCGASPVSCREGAGSWSGQISCRSCGQSGRGHAWLAICGVNVSEHVMTRYDKIWQVIMRWIFLKYEYANAHFTVLFHSIFQVSESLPQVHREKKWNVWPWAWFWDVLGRSFKKGLLVRQALWFIVQFTPLLVENFIREGNARYVLENNGFSPVLQPACYPDEHWGLTLAKGMLAEFWHLTWIHHCITNTLWSWKTT